MWRRFNRWVALLALVLVVLGAPLVSQGPFSAEIERFWTMISTGGRAFSTLVAQSVTFGATSTTGANANTLNTKQVTGIPDNTPTTILTWSAPNATVTATVHIYVTGILGAGGAVGQSECSTANDFSITITRVAGLNAMSAASSFYNATGNASVTGGTTCTIARALSVISGGATAVNTQQIQLTIARGTGSSSNHIALVRWEIENYTANGVTIS